MKNYRISAVKTTAEKKALIRDLEKNIRDIDRREIEGLGFSTRQGVEISIYETCPVYVARTAEGGRLIACWGLQVLEFKGKEKTTYSYIIWALGTDELTHHKKDFIKESTALINRWVELYGTLENTVATFNKNAIRWLKWLGAEFSEPHKINGTEYVNFKIKRKKE